MCKLFITHYIFWSIIRKSSIKMFRVISSFIVYSVLILSNKIFTEKIGGQELISTSPSVISMRLRARGSWQRPIQNNRWIVWPLRKGGRVLWRPLLSASTQTTRSTSFRRRRVTPRPPSLHPSLTPSLPRSLPPFLHSSLTPSLLSFLPSSLLPFLPIFLPSFLPSVPSVPPSFLPSSLPSFVAYLLASFLPSSDMEAYCPSLKSLTS